MKVNSHLSPRLGIFLCWIIVSSFSGLSAQTWDGGGANDNWTTANNWNPNTVPVNDGTADIVFAGIIRLNVLVDSARDVNSITFDNTAGAFTLSNNSITIQGGGLTNNDADTQTINSNLILGANQTWNANSGNLALGGTVSLGTFTLTLTGASNTTLSGSIQNTGSVVKEGTGTVTYSGATGNTYSGTTTINAGTMVLAKTSGDASQGSWVVGDGTGTDILRLGASQQIQDSSAINVTVNSSGLFDLNGFNETLAQITLVGGAVTTGAGTLTIGNLGGSGITSNASTTGATISGNLALNPFFTTITVADGSAANDLTISANISGNRIIKEGDGVLVLSGNNTYTDGGATGFNPSLTINAGTVSVSSVTNFGNPNNDVWLNGGTLRVTGNINPAAGQRFYVNSGGGTFEITSGNTLTIDNNNQLRSTGGTGTLTKSGAGTLLISSNNTTSPFAGPVVVDDGTLRLTSTNRSILLGATSNGNNGQPTFTRPLGNSGSYTVNNGATFSIQTFGTTPASSQRIILQAASSLTVNDGGTVNWTTSLKDIEFYGTATVDGSSALVNLNAENDVKFNGNFTMTNASQMTILAPDGVLVGSDGTGLLSIQSGSDVSVDMGGTTKVNQTFNIQNGGTVVTTGSGSTLTIGNAGAFTGLLTEVSSGGTLRVADSSTVTVDDAILTRLASGSTFDGGTATSKGTLVLTGDLQVQNPTVSNTPNLTMTTSGSSSVAPISGSAGITGLGTFTKTGSGTTTLASTLTTNGFGAQTIDVNQGTLLLGASNRIDDSSNFRMSGGTFSTGGFSETVGTLTLTADSTINMGAGSSILNFANSSSASWTSGTTLSITDWSGIPVTGGGTDQIYFGTTSSGLTSSQLAQIVFINPAGLDPGTYAAMILATGEVVPVPEPGVYLSGALLLSWLIGQRRRSSRLAARTG